MVHTYFISFYLCVSQYISQIVRWFYLSIFSHKNAIKVNESSKDIATKYTDNHIARFMKSFENMEQDTLYNSNIDSLFYSKKEYAMLLQDEKNRLEPQWKTRILFESTPRGNIVMYYDVYKLAFSYHCDQYIPHDILNAAAMKYVLTFKCRDFFVDELVRPQDKPSKMLVLLEEDKKEENKTVDADINIDENLKIALKKAPFAKFKNYHKINTNNDKDTESTASTVSKKLEQEKQRNRFTNLGKIVNFSFLQKPSKNKKKVGFNSEMESGLFSNSDVQKEVFNYRDFKRLQSENQENQ